MEQSLELVQVHGEDRLDSRLVSASLGIEHESLMRTLHTYETAMQELGILRFQIGEITGRGKPQKYALLNEDQAIFAATLSRNTERVVAFKLQLTLTFAQARKRHQQAAPAPAINTLWQQRLETFNRSTRLPLGYWCVFGMVASFCWTEEMRGVQLLEDALPDGSIGRKWCAYLREQGYDMHLVRKYPHRYPDQRGTVQANIYPSEWLGTFWLWFHREYLPHDYPVYLQTHARALPAPHSKSTRPQKPT